MNGTTKVLRALNEAKQTEKAKMAEIDAKIDKASELITTYMKSGEKGDGKAQAEKLIKEADKEIQTLSARGKKTYTQEYSNFNRVWKNIMQGYKVKL